MHLKFKNVSVSYPLLNSRSQSLKRALITNVGGKIDRDMAGDFFVEALRNVSFELKPRDRIALIGHNGAGKSTILKVASGAYEPTVGSIEIEGSRRSLIDIGLGIEGELTGRENIERKLIFDGYNSEIRKTLVEEIIEFTELEEYINLPIRTYSTGMSLRLAFSIATCRPVDLLIMDEIIGAGDENFRNKMNRRMESFIKSAGSLLISTHDLNLAKNLCNKAILLESGSVAAEGTVDEVLSFYLSRSTKLANQ